MLASPLAPADVPSGPKDAPPVEQRSTTYTLPSSWWSSERLYELERRAIFSQSWLYVTHASRFDQEGTYFTYEIAGYPFFIVREKAPAGQELSTPVLRAFHNACRHRAYPVAKKKEGNVGMAGVLSCGYHGWCYDTRGTLRKAPQFDKVPGFDKSANSLFPIHTHVTESGHVFVNFTASPSPPAFSEVFQGLEDELKEFDFSNYDYRESFELRGDFNWKALMDGYQECYHCPTAHPGLSKAFAIPTYRVAPRANYCRHFANLKPSSGEGPKQPQRARSSSLTEWLGSFIFSERPAEEQEAEKQKNMAGEFNGLWVYLFPNNGINCYSPAWYSIRVIPVSATKTILEYDIFAKKGVQETEIVEFIDFLKQVEIEDFNLCVATQRNLRAGVYSSGVLHPEKENGVLYYQNLVREKLLQHYEAEKAAGKEISPAAAGSRNSPEDELCRGLESGLCGGSKELEW
ncbi:ISP domain-containing protein [Gloeophyllum trabeum ATCC 11539]|uniref:Choline monooxygenase, chloroplastic n=1 Tax=Gloeophyllum trabeum (strain ATCC 11539 / FP-39264 / Madison 617) TaxID=670483 RepID=S7QCQ5_GLOTA|nr:ISP domain-containing protein [Gloeophyllum trabeum ATCC 11539]EPQ57132.1 ISP domain-containing protein [Gloeophyllum trabeum ATCC 11539]